MITKTLMSDAKAVDDAEGIVEAYTNTMGVIDADGDVVDPTAFDQSIRENLPIPVLSGHDQSSLVGKVIFAQPQYITGDEYRLYTRMQFNLNTEAGRDAYSNVAGDYIREWSVGFNIPQEGDISRSPSDTSTIIRHIDNLDWVEVSMVIRGSSPSTVTVAAKSAASDEPSTSETESADASDPAASDTADAASDTDRRRLLLAQTRLAIKHNKSVTK